MTCAYFRTGESARGGSMPEDYFRKIKELLASSDPEDLRRGLDLVRNEISRVGADEARPLFEVVSTIFYIDPLDRPDLVPVLDEAASLIVGFGRWIIPVLVKRLDEGDLKAQLIIAHALGRMGADAIGPLMDEYYSTSKPALHSFVLYALGKIKSPKIEKAAHIAIEAAESDDRELRDTATRVIGKFAESIPAGQILEDIRLLFVKRLKKNLSDESSGIRAKALRSLGKMAKFGHLTDKEKEKLKAAAFLILGEADEHEWDYAYIVRKEASEVLSYIS
jgi:HEAT repeat protein